jgi:hypothetical protein
MDYNRVFVFNCETEKLIGLFADDATIFMDGSPEATVRLAEYMDAVAILEDRDLRLFTIGYVDNLEHFQTLFLQAVDGGGASSDMMKSTGPMDVRTIVDFVRAMTAMDETPPADGGGNLN